MRRAPCTRFLLAAAGLTALFWVAATPVFAGPATDRLREFFGTVNAVLADPAIQSKPLEKVARIKHLVTDVADVRGAAAAVLDAEWQARTAAEREEFSRLFAELLERGIVARLAGTVSPVNGMIMTWRDETRVGDEARVTTLVESRDGRKILVEYRMYARRGRWLVRDVVVDGISTIDNYRAQFRRVLRQGSYGALITQLRAKLGEDTLMFAQPSHVPTPAEVAAASRPSPAPRVAARAPSSAHVAKSASPMIAKAPPIASTPPVVNAPPAPNAGAPAVAKASTPPVTQPSTSTIASANTPRTAKPRAAVVAKAAAPPAPAMPTRAPRVAMAPVVPPPADVLSPLSTADMTADVLPSALLLMLGLGGVSAAVYLRRRASGHALTQRFGDRHQNLVLLHPVPRVAKVREGRRKRRVVPPPRNPSRHVDDAHGA
jgi:phospholipid transport system substrate-binding protein